MKKSVGAFSIKSGATEGGVPPQPSPVGGDVCLIDKLSLIVSLYWPFIAVMLILLSYFLYSRKHKIIQFLGRLK